MGVYEEGVQFIEVMSLPEYYQLWHQHLPSLEIKPNLNLVYIQLMILKCFP
jgi:hypothetical protein